MASQTRIKVTIYLGVTLQSLMFIMTQVVAWFVCLCVAVANGAVERFVAEPDIPELVQRLDALTNQVNENKAEIAKLREYSENMQCGYDCSRSFYIKW
ncbi:hypothetical protein DPMN_025364 [Dreissena polymorpha]|uniref:Uncharacterized protein n=1 Tax=Dreissena polymorpha TaxID=45954 RepID=A0A9D4RD95_DREPO|nr:hypothetical protein DPMN_025364 [Dreissena polymorpha]